MNSARSSSCFVYVFFLFFSASSSSSSFSTVFLKRHYVKTIQDRPKIFWGLLHELGELLSEITEFGEVPMNESWSNRDFRFGDFPMAVNLWEGNVVETSYLYGIWYDTMR
jgi:hypothetical protein